MTKKRKKTDHSIAICSVAQVCIFCLVPVESSCLSGSEYVCQRGVEGVLGWVKGSRRLPYFKKNVFAALQIKVTDTIFQIANLKYFRPIDYGKKWFRFASSVLKIVGVGFICYTSYFYLRTAFRHPHPTSGNKNRVKTAPQPLFTKKRLVPYA